MGYSLVLKFKTEAERDEVLTHLERYFEPVSKHFGLPFEDHGPVSDPVYSGDLPGELILGFDYHVLSDLDALHALMVCEWAIINLDCELWYDGDELWKRSKHSDNLGIFDLTFYCQMSGARFLVTSAKKELSLIRKNIELIDSEWKKDRSD